MFRDIVFSLSLNSKPQQKNKSHDKRSNQSQVYRRQQHI